MTHGELLRRMSGDEFAHWIAFYRRRAREQERTARQARARSRRR